MNFPYALTIAACLTLTCATAQTARTDKLSPLVRKAAAHAHAQRTAPEAGDIRSDVAHFAFNGRTYAWNSNTGTSMATPVVAGAIALWLQAPHHRHHTGRSNLQFADFFLQIVQEAGSVRSVHLRVMELERHRERGLE